MRIVTYILEVLVLAFIVTAFIFISKQEHIDEVKVEQEADSTSNIQLDRLNDPDYFNRQFDEDTTVSDSALVNPQ